jgi:hypothetical protein
MAGQVYNGTVVSTKFNFLVDSNVHLHHYLTAFDGPDNSTVGQYVVATSVSITSGTPSDIEYLLVVSDVGHYTNVKSVIIIIADLLGNAGVAYYAYAARSGQSITIDFGVPLSSFGYPLDSVHCIFGLYYSFLIFNPSGTTVSKFQWIDPKIRTGISVTAIIDTSPSPVVDVRLTAVCFGLCADS